MILTFIGLCLETGKAEKGDHSTVCASDHYDTRGLPVVHVN